jgi:hypothetical protein
MSNRQPIMDWASVFAGERCIGHIVGRNRFGYEGFDRDDKSLGVFSTQQAAAVAVETASGRSSE